MVVKEILKNIKALMITWKSLPPTEHCVLMVLLLGSLCPTVSLVLLSVAVTYSLKLLKVAVRRDNSVL